jgi:ZIP family zinc transporter
MLASGWSRGKITRLWLAVCALSMLAAAVGYGLGHAFPGVDGTFIDAFAAGSLLVMLTDAMIPESFEHGGKQAGLLLVLGFACATAMVLAELT